VLKSEIVDRRTATGHRLGAMKITGDHGGHIYLMCEASRVRATDEVLRRLGLDLDSLISPRRLDYEVAVRWVITNPWEEWGWEPEQESGLWVWRAFLQHGVDVSQLCDVLSGRRDRILLPPLASGL
jgi:hypothetical protein